ncbi:hypothetical protein AAHA92_13512 [Salvia divinorum]|uniref:Uncharacterized protein n=1 Tax=Salvia divinorum TaxID=28513 RepID=A0ABD1H9B4_SALDI
MGAGQAVKRIPRIKFPQRHPKPSVAINHVDDMSAHDLKNDDLVMKFFSRAPSAASGGKASDQPKRSLVSEEEIDAVMLGGCF